MRFETRLNDDLQTIIPSHFVKKHDLEEGDLVLWDTDDDGRLIITFKKSKLNLEK